MQKKNFAGWIVEVNVSHGFLKETGEWVWTCRWKEVIACFICVSIPGTNQLINTLMNQYCQYKTSKKVSQKYAKKNNLFLHGSQNYITLNRSIHTIKNVKRINTYWDESRQRNAKYEGAITEINAPRYTKLTKTDSIPVKFIHASCILIVILLYYIVPKNSTP